MESNTNNNEESNQQEIPTTEYIIDVGSIVEVLPRTWPGSNKQGGTARVTKCHYNDVIITDAIDQSTSDSKESKISATADDIKNDNSQKVLTHVDVRYTVVGGSEKKVPMEYVNAAPQYDQTFIQPTLKPMLRDRNTIVGRCSRCGSLRIDCGACDYAYAERQSRENNHHDQVASDNNNRSKYRRRSRKNRRVKFQHDSNTNGNIDEYDDTSSSRSFSSSYSADDYYDDDSDSSDDEHLQLYRRRKEFPILKRTIINDSSSSSDMDSSSSSSNSSDNSDDEDDELLSKLRTLSKQFKNRVRTLAKKTKEENSNVIVPTISKLKKKKRRKKRFKAKYADKVNSVSNVQLKKNLKVSRVSKQASKSVLEATSRGDSQLSKNLDESNMSQTMRQYDHSAGTSIVDKHKNDHSVNKENEEVIEQILSDDELPESAFQRSDNIEKDDSITPQPKIGYVRDEDIGDTDDDEFDRTQQEHSHFTHTPIYEEKNTFTQDTLVDEYHYFGPHSNSQDLDFDQTFIQPEGEKAAESLPSDMVDKSRNIPFFELPLFFDSVEKKLREEQMPLASLEIDQLKHKIDTDIDVPNIELFKKKSHVLYMKLCIKLIRDGTDQCRAALKRFESKKLFLKCNSNISKKDWKRQKEALNLKLDQLDNDVETLMVASRDLRDIAMDKTDNDNDYHNYDSAESGSFDKENNDDDYDGRISTHILSPEELQDHPHAKIVRGKTKTSQHNLSYRDFRNNKKRKRQAAMKKRSTNEYSGVINQIGQNSRFNLDKDKQTQINENKRNTDVHQEDTNLLRRVKLSQPGRASHIRNSKSTAQVKHLNGQTHHKSDRATIENISKIRPQAKQTKTTNKFNQEYHDESDASEDFSSGGWLSEVKLFDELLFDIGEKRIQSDPRTDFSSVTPYEICSALSNNYPHNEDESADLLKRLPQLLHLSLPINDREIAIHVFNTLLNIYKNHGSLSLLEMTQVRGDKVLLHIKLLICTVQILDLKLQNNLNESDGIIFKFFSVNGKDSIVEFIILQLLDLLYAQLLPTVWCTKSSMTPELYRLLKELRDEIGKVVHIIEIISKLIHKDFQCQKWQRSSVNKDVWFVSSISTNYLSLFWTNKSEEETKEISRLRSFGKAIPRKEIKTLWSLLAFFAGSRSNGVESKISWKLVLSLFTFQSGVLGRNNAEDDVPPSPSHNLRCANEIRYLTYLMDSKSLDPMPSDDSSLIKIIDRAINMDLASILDERWTQNDILAQKIKKKDARLVDRCWRESDVSTKLSSESCLATLLLADFNNRTDEGISIFQLTCPSPILQNCLYLLSSWIIRIPDKKARWNRLQESLSRLLKNLVQSFSGDSNSGALQDEFSMLFSTSNMPLRQQTMKQYRKRESTAFLMVGIIYACINAEVRLKSKICLPIGKLTIKTIHQIWDMISNDQMRNQLKCIDDNVPFSFDGNRNDSLDFPFNAMKIFSLLMLKVLNGFELYSTDDYWESMDNQSLVCLASCILASLVTVCDILVARMSIASRSNMFPLSHERIEQKDLDSCFNVLSCGFLWISSISSYGSMLLDTKSIESNRILQSPLGQLAKYLTQKSIPVLLYCLKCITKTITESKSASKSLHLCLAQIKSSISFTSAFHKIKGKHNHENHNGNSDDTMYGGIDDDMLMAINLDSLNGSDSENENDDINQLLQFFNEAVHLSRPSFLYKQDTNDQITRCGKMLCKLYTHEFCATVAHLCSDIDKKSQKRIDCAFDIFYPPTPFVMQQGNDRHYLKSDVAYWQQLRQFFAFEFTKLSQCLELSITLNIKQISSLIKSLIEAALDANAINIFPTSNIQVMNEVGGQGSIEREEELSNRLLSSLAPEVNDTGSNFEVLCLDRVKNHNGLFIAKFLWTFASNLGTILCKDSYGPLKCVGEILLQRDFDMNSTVQELSEDVLGSLSLVSLERQCLKRFILLRGLFDAILNNDGHDYNQIYISTMITTLIKQIFQELDFIAEGSQYNNNERDDQKSYEVAKLKALQKAYTQLVISTASWIVKQIASSKLESSFHHANFIFDKLLLPSLQRGRLDRDLNNSYKNNIVSFDFIPKLFEYEHMSSDLYSATNNHIKELVIYAAYVEEEASTKFYEIMNTTFCKTQQNSTIMIHILPALVSDIEYQSKTNSTLSVALNIYISIISLKSSSFKKNDNKAMKRFRSFAVKFAARNLFSKESSKRAVMLDHLGELLSKTSIYGHSDFITIQLAQNHEEYLDIHDACLIISGLSSCIESITCGSNIAISERVLLIRKAFDCFNHLLSNIRNVEFFKWCHKAMDRNEQAMYFVTEIRFLFCLGLIVNDNYQCFTEIKEPFMSLMIDKYNMSENNKYDRIDFAHLEALSKKKEALKISLNRLSGSNLIISKTNCTRCETANIDTVTFECFSDYMKKIMSSDLSLLLQ